MKTKIKMISLGVGALFIFVCSLSLGIFWESRKHEPPVITPSSIAERLYEASDLATAKMDYRGLVRYQDGDLPLITKKAFTMVYDASIRAGIDLSAARITLDDEGILVALPKSTIQDVTIDPDSLEFYDEKWALFNPEKREDTVVALQSAKEDARAYAEETQMLEKADAHVQRLIEELLAPTLDTLNEDSEEPLTIRFTLLE